MGTYLLVQCASSVVVEGSHGVAVDVVNAQDDEVRELLLQQPLLVLGRPLALTLPAFLYRVHLDAPASWASDRGGQLIGGAALPRNGRLVAAPRELANEVGARHVPLVARGGMLLLVLDQGVEAHVLEQAQEVTRQHPGEGAVPARLLALGDDGELGCVGLGEKVGAAAFPGGWVGGWVGGWMGA